jgi:hypothetical protein
MYRQPKCARKGRPTIKEGICKLTGEKGKFVKCHIIPAALTKLAGTNRLIQSGPDDRPKKRASSWYDRHLVTDAGEAILARYDDWAITELRKHRLIWSSWGPMVKLAPSDFKLVVPNSNLGLREIPGVDLKRLRMFFLSLLWRAAVTKLAEFSAVRLNDRDLDRLRKMVITGEAEPMEYYPITLIQLSTLGFQHNFSVNAGVKTNPGYGKIPDLTIPHFRFYFDGLIAHIHREAVGQLNETIIGAHPNLTVTTVPFEGSRQYENLIAGLERGVVDFSIQIDRII